MLVELENTGILVSHAYSRGRRGYGKEYKLKVDPSLVGPSVDKEFYNSLIKQKQTHEGLQELEKLRKSRPSFRFMSGKYSNLFKNL